MNNIDLFINQINNHNFVSVTTDGWLDAHVWLETS